MDINCDLDTTLLGVTVLLMCFMNEKKPRRKRRWSVRPLNTKRFFGNFKSTFDEMMAGDEEYFFRYIRMDKNTFCHLLKLVCLKIVKKKAKTTILPKYRLALTLHYLAHGLSMQKAGWGFYCARSTASKIIAETCQAIWEVLSPIYLKEPTVQNFAKIAQDFQKQWNLPNCIGALDGKHIHIQAPKKSGSLYLNYKKRFSLVLMAVCDANYIFTMVDIGAYGSSSDGGVFKESSFGAALDNGELTLPPDALLPNTGIRFPHFLAADEAFPLKRYIMRPFPGKHLNNTQRIFNYRLSRGRRCIENAFGIMTARWRILRNDIIAEVYTIEKITAAVVCLHNFLMITQKSKYCPSSYCDRVLPNGTLQEGLWREEIDSSWQSLGRTGANNRSRTVTEERNVLADYFSNAGAVSWQQDKILVGSYPLTNSESDPSDSE